MALRAKKPEAVQKRLKAFFYGPSGVGKTTAAIQFPRPYLIDTERGAENEQYAKMLTDQGGVIFQTSDFDDVMAEITSLMQEKHEFRTLIIDPMTVLHDGIVDRAIALHGQEFGRYKGDVKRQMKRLITMLYRLDMNVICTSHAKPKWVRTTDSKGRETATQEGLTFDCYDGIDYMMDLVFEVNMRGKNRVGIVRKSRVEAFPEGEVFPFTYAEIADRYGASKMEEQAAPQALASEDQVAKLGTLVRELAVPEETVSKWLEKAEASNFAEMPAEVAAKCIAWCENQKKGVA